MESLYSSLAWSIAILSAAVFLLLSRRQPHKRSNRLPPGPPGWPIIGNILDLGTMPHQTLYNLKPKYGPVLWLKLGSVNTMVIQSAKAAAELFKNHDHVFCDRKCPEALAAHGYKEGSLALGQYGAYWRLVRRLCSMELLVNKRVNETAQVRRQCVHNMIRGIEAEVAAAQERGESGEVNLPHHLFLMTFNLVGNLMLSRDLLDSNSKEGHEFYEAMNNIMFWTGKPNLADFLPLLKPLDPQKVMRNMVPNMGLAMKIVGGFVKERVELEKEKLEGDRTHRDFLDALLENEGDETERRNKISFKEVNIIILEMFFAGSETTSSTLEWAMVELLRSPGSMRKAKEELDRVVGPTRKVEETDMEQLPYLQAVVKETLRLHPAIPLLLPRNAMQDVTFMGYRIPKGTQVFVNAWTIGRDPETWEDPLSFKPERFLGSNIDYKGQNFELIPFGSGRRICVGISLAHRVVQLGLASLLHSFDWETASETLDMVERIGITLRKLTPLKVIPKKRVM